VLEKVWGKLWVSVWERMSDRMWDCGLWAPKLGQVYLLAPEWVWAHALGQELVV
jgi:hypothetical protein